MKKRYIYVKKKYIFLAAVIDAIGNILFAWKKIIGSKGTDVKVKKIAVIELAHIGDVLAITPSLQLLKIKFPAASITAIVSPWSKDVLIGNPDINGVMVYRASWFDRVEKKPFSLFETIKLIKFIRQKKFDLGFDMRGDFRVILLMWLGRIKRRVGYSYAGGGFLLTDIKPFNVEKRQERHQIEYNIELVDLINGARKPNIDKIPRIFVSDYDISFVNNILKAEGILADDLLVSIHLGAGVPSKRWPIDRFALLIDKITEKYRTRVIVVGGAEEKPLSDKLKSITKANVIDMGGKTNIKQLAALIKRCNLFIGGDSGVMHIASTVGTPIIAIWAGHDKPSHWRPLSPDSVVIYRETDCSPCGFDNCTDLECLKLITIDDVFTEVEKKMKNIKS